MVVVVVAAVVAVVAAVVAVAPALEDSAPGIEMPGLRAVLSLPLRPEPRVSAGQPAPA